MRTPYFVVAGRRLPYRIPLAAFAVGLLVVGIAPAQAWQTDFDRTGSEFSAMLALRKAQGLRLVSVSARRSPAGDRFELIWKRDTTTAWKASHGLTHAQYLSRLVGLGKIGYRPVSVDSYGAYPSERYVAVFAKDAVVSSTRSRMTAAEYQTEQARQTTNKYRLAHVGSSGSGTSTRYVGIWVKPQATQGSAHGLNLTDFQKQITSWKSRGGRLVSIATAGTAAAPTFAGVWDVPAKTTQELVAQTLNELRDSTFVLGLQGYTPTAVAAYDTAKGSRYVSSWTLTSAMRVFTTTGTAVPELAGFDTAMNTLMRLDNVTKAALAITWKGRLVLARGYTWAPPGTVPTEPQSLFRIASLTKPTTAVGILRLVQKGKIKIDQKVNTILDMRGWKDARVQGLTVRHLLNHWGGWDRTISPDPMRYDFAISKALNRPLPTTPQMIQDYMKTQMLDRAPGVKYVYSNFGYSTLGRIIEAASGMSYEGFMLREVFLPIGASSFRVTDSLRGDQVSGEVDYDDVRMAPSVMGPSSPPMVQYPYGRTNRRSADSAGGLVCSAIDYARFLVAFDDHNNSPLLSKALIDEMYKRPPWDKNTGTNYYAMGRTVIPVGGGRFDARHNGGLEGTHTRMYRRNTGMNYVVFYNKNTFNIRANTESMLLGAANRVTKWPIHDLFSKYASVDKSDAGCAGSNGVPYVRPMRGSLAKVGFPFTIELTSIGTSPTQHLPFLVVGGSRTTWSGLPLPLNLTGIGMPKCWLNVSPDVLVPLPNRGGTAWLSFDIPNDTSYVGAKLFLQGVVTDAKANPAGLVSSPGAAIHVGVR